MSCLLALRNSKRLQQAASNVQLHKPDRGDSRSPPGVVDSLVFKMKTGESTMKEAFLNVLFDLRIMSLCVVVSQVIALASTLSN